MAEHNALFRAIEQTRPPQDRVVTDPIAKHFLSVGFRVVTILANLPWCRQLITRYIDYRWPGARTSVIGRTRLIDHYMKEAIASGVQQIVLLGAGFDTRSLRLRGVEGARTFEVDHPSTSAIKQKVVKRLTGDFPKHVVYVAADFQSDSVDHALKRAGFDECKSTLVVWEGVSNYLTESSVRATLMWIGSMPAGTVLIFTYIDAEVLKNPSAFVGGKDVQRLIAKLDEPWTFGIRPELAASFLLQSGLQVESDASAREYRRECYGAESHHRGYDFYHVVKAIADGRMSVLD